jgi:hypothetical protein
MTLTLFRFRSMFMPTHAFLPHDARHAIHIALIRATLRALVATHPNPEQLASALEREFTGVLQQSVSPALAEMVQGFLDNLHATEVRHEQREN